MSNKSGGWVFISHSHQDISLVRQIRNYLEGMGFEPLMFFLKCLSDDDEIEELIKREIREREWFLFADSPNARVSKWVQTERAYIETLTGKRVFTIDLKADLEQQLREIRRIGRQMRVFLSYAYPDTRLAEKLRDKFIQRDMLVHWDRDLTAGVDWAQSARAEVENACREGFVVLLITEAFAKSACVRQEIQSAIAAKGKIVPVFVGKATLPPDLLQELGDVQGCTVAEDPSEEALDQIVEQVLRRVEYYHSDFTTSAGYRSAESIRLPAISRIDNLTFWDCENLKCVFIPDTVIYITPDAFEDHPHILVRCHPGSYAEQYCRRNQIRYELVQPEGTEGA